jgi:hypothetical protein
MAPIVPLPRIREENYKAFLALPTKNIPDTFNKWRDDQATEELHYIRNGWTIEPIEVNPEEFFRFCRDRGLPIDSHAIKALVEEKSRRQRDEQNKLSSAGSHEGPNKIIESPEC